jgi:hypothetical protein
MQLARCPVCHSRISLDQLVQDEAGSELLGLLSKLDTQTGTALVSYLGLFRSGSRDLTNDRALKLAKEIMQIEATQWLTPALQETIESLREKRMNGEVKPLANHNYLKRVLESVVSRSTGQAHSIDTPAPAEKYNSAAASKQRLTDTNW